MKLRELVNVLTLREKRNWDPELEVRGITSDSRRVTAGDLFVACSGPKTDGHQYFQEAHRRGSRVWIGEKPPSGEFAKEIVFLGVPDSRIALNEVLNQFHGFPARKLRLVGITGTNGKTTIAYLLNHLLNKKIPSAYIGTLGFQTTEEAGTLGNTTPGAEELFSLLARMVAKGIQAVVLEVSSHALHQKRVHGLEFELALFTQLSAEHLDYHQTMEEYFQAKRLLFAGTPRPPGRMLIGCDSSYGRRLLSEMEEAQSFGLGEEAGYRGREVATGFSASEFLLEGPQSSGRFRIQLPMTHNVVNAVAALAALELLGFDPLEFRGPLAEFPGVPGRLERIEGNGCTVFVDYAHTPDAFEHILSEARRLAPKRVLTLFGCGGDRDPYKRPEMTRIAYHYSDFVILTSDNPRTEDPAEIIRQMRRGLPTNSPVPNVLEILDRRQALAEILTLAEPGDVIFILGKGHEDYQILGTKKVPFDDREEVRKLLKRKKHAVL